jgi:hypothetical protein
MTKGGLSPELIAFRRGLHYCYWELKSKLEVMKEFAQRTDSMTKTVTLAKSLKSVKEVRPLL